MIYFLAYFSLGIILVVLEPRLSRKYSTPEERLLRISEHCRRQIESRQYPNGLPFSDRSARVVGESIGLVVAIVVWPVIAINLLRRIKKNRQLPIKDRDGTKDRFADK